MLLVSKFLGHIWQIHYVIDCFFYSTPYFLAQSDSPWNILFDFYFHKKWRTSNVCFKITVMESCNTFNKKIILNRILYKTEGKNLVCNKKTLEMFKMFPVNIKRMVEAVYEFFNRILNSFRLYIMTFDFSESF